MKIALIGATGFIGSKLLDEALARQHQVSALVGHPEKLAARANLAVIGTDVLDQAKLAEQLTGHEAVISAFSGHAQSNTYDYYVQGIQSIIKATRQAGVARLLVVGGAGSLEVAPGLQMLDTPDFPAQWKATAEGARHALQLLKQEPELNWTMLSPSALIVPGERSGKFRFGLDQLLVDEQGQSRISVEDYAVAMLDELERPVHLRQRFTVGY
jgi:uncharacterized protein